MEAWRITQVTYLGSKVHDCIHFLGRQHKAEKVHGLDVTLHKLQKAGGVVSRSQPSPCGHADQTGAWAPPLTLKFGHALIELRFFMDEQ